MDIPVEVQNAGREAIAAYKKALPYGEKWAAMCALQIAPGTKGSDRAFMEGRMNNQQLDDMPVRQAKYIAGEARQAGINISGKYYCGGIADKRGWRDPAAWVSSNDDILRVAKARRLAVSGTVNYDPGVAPPKRKLIADSILKEEMAREKRINPSAKDADIKEKVIKKHAYRAKGRGV
jgi:hypothetical protein